MDRKLSVKQYRADAIRLWECWNGLEIGEAGGSYSLIYKDGFIDGYTDQMLLGGPGKPPVLPPSRYWWKGKRSVPGPQRRYESQDWFEGFRAGAAVAMIMQEEDVRTVPTWLTGENFESTAVSSSGRDQYEEVPTPADAAPPLP